MIKKIKVQESHSAKKRAEVQKGQSPFAQKGMHKEMTSLWHAGRKTIPPSGISLLAQKVIQESVDKAAREHDRPLKNKQEKVETTEHQKEEKEPEKSKKDLPERSDDTYDKRRSDSSLPSTPELSPSDLEATLSREKARETAPEVNSPYVLELSQAPIRSLKKEMTDIYLAVEEKGYISREEGRRVEYLSSAVERKLDAIESGKYSLTEEVAQAASLTQKLGSALHDMYHHGKKAKQDGNDLYFRSG
ncbi:MAG: hypothetical protein Q8R37_05555 [Nanoarchaeota archaeon]|nr:hypothetical protein [Nanoarchaeota archaeon]